MRSEQSGNRRRSNGMAPAHAMVSDLPAAADPLRSDNAARTPAPPGRHLLEVRHRSVFISDIHLGSAHSHAEALAEFLADLRCRSLYLVGDVFDLEALTSRQSTWGAAQTAVVDALRPFGVRHLDMPLRAERVWRALQEARR